MPDNNPAHAHLLAELRELETLLGAHGNDGQLTALVRLVRSGASWTDLLRKHGLDQWLTLPLKENTFTALARIQEQLAVLSFQKDHDGLTGLRNRRAFNQALTLEIERAARFKTPLSLALLDLDNFKIINDTHGHPCGDLVIQAMASILLKETRKIDIASRIGGEEFALILPGTGLIRAQKLLERILDCVRRANVRCDTAPRLNFTCSIGLASYRGKVVPDPDKLMAEADKALYAAKKSGKNRIESAPLLDLGREPDQTLVQHDEKRFLFSSFHTPSPDAERKD